MLLSSNQWLNASGWSKESYNLSTRNKRLSPIEWEDNKERRKMIEKKSSDTKEIIIQRIYYYTKDSDFLSSLKHKRNSWNTREIPNKKRD